MEGEPYRPSCVVASWLAGVVSLWLATATPGQRARAQRPTRGEPESTVLSPADRRAWRSDYLVRSDELEAAIAEKQQLLQAIDKVLEATPRDHPGLESLRGVRADVADAEGALAGQRALVRQVLEGLYLATTANRDGVPSEVAHFDIAISETALVKALLARCGAFEDQVKRWEPPRLEMLERLANDSPFPETVRERLSGIVPEERGRRAGILETERIRLTGGTPPRQILETLEASKHLFEQEPELCGVCRRASELASAVEAGWSRARADRFARIRGLARTLELVDDEPAELQSWKVARLERHAEDWVGELERDLKALRDGYFENWQALDAKPSYERGDSPIVASCRDQRGRYAELLEQLRALRSDLPQLAPLLRNLQAPPVESLPPIRLREFPATWSGEARRLWPERFGPVGQRRNVRFEHGYWFVEGRSTEMVLVPPRLERPPVFSFAGACTVPAVLLPPRVLAPFLVDRTEVTCSEFCARMSRDPGARTIALDRWWNEHRFSVSASVESDPMALIHGISFVVARDFAATLVPGLDQPLRLPTCAQWDAAWDLAGLVATPLEVPDASQLVIEPSVPADSTAGSMAIRGLDGGVAEWCRFDGEIRVVVSGVSLFKPWTDVRGGFEAWESAMDEYFGDPRRRSERPAYLCAPAYGFRCVYELQEDPWQR
ncbi:MAG: hypothetical protein KDE27_10015 [Planctomycetes bacterium]|nr:hypothetical protein [Planctomycetota bacterium]